MEYCLTKDGHCFEGSAADVVNAICEITLIDRRLVVRFSKNKASSWNEPREFHSYGDSWAVDEMCRDACQFVLERLTRDYGYRIYFSTQ